MDYPTSSAGRLHGLLVAFRERASLGVSCQAVWADLFGLEADDLVTIFSIASELASLPACVRDELSSIPERLATKEYLAAIPLIATATRATTLLGEDSSKQATSVTDHVLLVLRLTSAHLDDLGPFCRIATDQLDQLRESIDTLMADVLRAEEVPPALRLAVLSSLERISHTLRLYRLFGSPRLQEAVDELSGAVIRVGSAAVQDGAAKHQTLVLLRRVWRIVMSASGLLQGVAAGDEIAGSIQKMLGQ